MRSTESRFLREQAGRCRNIARLADELRQQLTDLALDIEGRSEGNDVLEDRSLQEQASSPISPVAKTPEPLVLSIKEAARLLGLGRSSIYRLIGESQLETVKIGNRTLIRTSSVRSLVDPRKQ